MSRFSMRLVGSVWFAMVLIALTPRAALACSCSGPAPACQAVFAAKAVFLGTVLSINQSSAVNEGTRRDFPGRRVRLSVTEAFRGALVHEVEIRTGPGEGDCGYPFQVGQTYVVYADGDEQLTTHSCSRTRLARDGADDLAFLRAMVSTPATEGRLRGSVTHDAGVGANLDARRKPFPGARVTFTAADRRLTAVSGADGTYELPAPVADYTVEIAVPSGYAVTMPPAPRFVDPRSCGAINFTVVDDGRVRGRAVDARGEPVPHLAVQIRDRRTGKPIDWRYPDRRTDAEGHYEFARLSAGEYLVVPAEQGLSALNPQAIPLAERATVDVSDVVLSAGAQLGTIKGVVLDLEGRPASGVSVSVGTDDFALSVGPPLVTGADGRFEITCDRNLSYTFSASVAWMIWDVISAEASGVRADGSTPPIVLQLKKFRSE